MVVDPENLLEHDNCASHLVIRDRDIHLNGLPVGSGNVQPFRFQSTLHFSLFGGFTKSHENDRFK